METMTLTAEFRSCWFIATFGCILYIAGTAVLFWNEGRAVHHIMSLDEALDAAISLHIDEEIPRSYDGRIVHINGPVMVGEPLTAPEYEIQVLAVKLKRRVQMYQWVEESMEHNGDVFAPIHTVSRSYYYVSEWRDDLVDSHAFYIQSGHYNPNHFPIESETQIADAAYIGYFELGQELKEKFTNCVELTSDTRPEDPSIKMHQGMYYHSNDVFNPEIGDIRLLFSVAGQEGELYTVVGKLENKKIVPYESSRGCKVLLLYPGQLNLMEVFRREHHAQRMTTWGYRFMGWVLVFFGVTCTSTLLHIMLSQVRILSVMAPDPEFPVGANIILSFSLALLIASIAWVLHRPLIGVALLFAAASPFMWCVRNLAEYQRVVY